MRNIFRKEASYRPPETSRPLPELLDGEDWEVRNSGSLKKAYIDFKKREFVVPFIYGPSGELVRAHEAMHVKISPHDLRVPKGVDKTTIQTVEDARVNSALRICSIQTNRGRVYKSEEIIELIQKEPERQTPLRLGNLFMSFKGTEEESDIEKIISALNPKVMPICEDVHRKYFGKKESSKELASSEDTEKAAIELTKRLHKISTQQEKQSDKNTKGQGNGSSFNATAAYSPGAHDGDEQQELEIITEEELEELKNALPHAISYRHISPGDYIHSHYSKAGTIKAINEPKLDKVIKFKQTDSIKFTPSDEGVIPTRMHRYATDQKLFSRKGKRRAGAAVLVDVSGSMSLTAQQVDRIVHQCPASIVAIYSGYRKDGIIRIIAKEGRYYSKCNDGMPGSNIIDYPAIQWLANRKEKTKIWISDGHVTGISDGALDPYEVRKIMHLMVTKKIIRVGNVKELISSGVLIDKSFETKEKLDELQRRSR